MYAELTITPTTGETFGAFGKRVYDAIMTTIGINRIVKIFMTPMNKNGNEMEWNISSRNDTGAWIILTAIHVFLPNVYFYACQICGNESTPSINTAQSGQYNLSNSSYYKDTDLNGSGIVSNTKYVRLVYIP